MYPKYIFIVPYRNRELEKIHFSIYMEYILENYDKSSYEIYYSEQLDNNIPFNRGATKNIGFLMAKNKYPDNYKDIIFIFNDIDSLPFKQGQLDYYTSKRIIKHFYGTKNTLGGIFSITGSDFELIKGFANLWGWGIEDNVLNNRAITNKITIDRSQFYSINDRNILSINSGYHKIMSVKETDNYFTNNVDNIDNIYNLEYSIVNNNITTKYNNQYIIKIKKFNTDTNPINLKYYQKDVSRNSTIKPFYHIYNNYKMNFRNY